MRKKLIIIFIVTMLFVTSATISAFNMENKHIRTNNMTHDIFYDEGISIISYIDPCIMPDNGLGTIDLPAMCPYVAPDDKMYIIEGLTPGTTIELEPTFDTFNNIATYPGGMLGGEVHTFDATLHLTVTGTGSLSGFNRNLATSASLEIHTGPRTPVDPIQIFPGEIHQLSGNIYGDPDFCTFTITAGWNYGLPSPGQYILTQLPSGDFNIDSFFDVTYQIEFEGCPGSILEGMAGTTTGTVRIQQGVEATNNPPNTPSQLSGNSSGIVGETIQYTSSATDPDDDDVKYGIDFHNDGVVDDWTDNYYPSGATITFYITFNYQGVFNLRLKAKDGHGAESGWSTPKTVTITSSSNNAPLTPMIPSGPTTGNIDISYTFTTSTTDPDSDNVKYGWDFDGDGTVDEWSGFYNSGDTCTMSNTWTSTGFYNIKVKAQDEHGLNSDWSTPQTITIIDNNPPLKPEITGPSSGKTGNSYTYYASTTDPDDDNLYYWIDWDDGQNTGWLGPFDSGLSASASHIWASDGTYSIKVKSKDEHETESEWSDTLSISMPRSKSIIPFGFIFVFGFDVDVKLVQLDPGEDYVDLEVLSKPFYIWENEIQTRNPGEFIRLYNAKGLFLPSLPICFGICNDWSIIG